MSGEQGGMIRQGFLVKGMEAQCSRYLTRYGLEPYHDKNAPAVFFGCYREKDLNRIREHKSLAILVWLGSDAMVLDRYPYLHGGKPKNIKHVAVGPFIERDLRRHRIPYRRINLTAVNMDGLEVLPLGEAVYTMIRPTRPDFYGRSVLRLVRARMPKTRFIVRDGLAPRAQVLRDYAESFMGVRLAKHDGTPKTVAELAFMGRRCVYRGDYPSSIGWRGTDDIVAAIRAERSRVGEEHPEVAEATSSFLEFGREWLRLEAWR